MDFGDGGVHVAARVEVFRVEAAIVHVIRPVGLSTWRCASIGCPQLGQNQLFFIGFPFCQNLSVMLLGIGLR
mgnify:FL=1